MKRLCNIFLCIVFFLIIGCSGFQASKQAHQNAANLLKNPPNPHTHVIYSTPEESEQVTSANFKEKLLKVQPDNRPLELHALIVLPSQRTINDVWLSGSKINVSRHIEINYEFIGHMVQKKNIFKTVDIKKSDQPKDFNASGYDVVLYPKWDTSAKPWEMEKWYLKKTNDGRVIEINKAVSQESWLYDIKLAAQGKPQSTSIDQVKEEKVTLPRRADVYLVNGRRFAPGSDGDLFRQGNNYFDKLEYKEAIAQYSKALNLNPTFFAAYFNRGLAYYILHLYDQAIADFSKHLELTSTKTDLWMLGAAYLRKGQFEQALTNFRRYLEVIPEDESRSELLGIIKKLEGKVPMDQKKIGTMKSN